VKNHKFSLLSITGEELGRCDILYDLSIDRAMYRICTDHRRVDYFLDVLSRPLTAVEDITFRQQIFRDLLEMPELFEKLCLQFSRYDRIKSDWQEMKLGAPPSAAAANPEALLDHIFASLKVTAFFPGTIAAFFRSVYELLEKHPIRAEGLIALRDYCGRMIENDSLDELVRIAQCFRYHTPDQFTFEMALTLDESLRACGVELSGIEKFEEKSAFATAIGKLFSRKEGDRQVLIDAEADGASYEDALSLLGDALGQIDRALTAVTSNLYDVMYGLSRELMFYEIAVAYHDHVTSLSLPTCIPEMLPAERDLLIMHGVRDLVLCSTCESGDAIVPNDMEIEELQGILVKGLTDTGKTVYLRSCGTAMIFAQAGLPVLAEDATLSVRTAFFSHFSSAEEEFLKGDVTGRFDQEAREIAAIIDHLTPHCLVMLNETFQTTSYQEGTEAIYNILSVLPLLPAKFLFVTHLTRLFDRMDASRVCLMETDPGGRFKLKRIRPEDHHPVSDGEQA